MAEETAKTAWYVGKYLHPAPGAVINTWLEIWHDYERLYSLPLAFISFEALGEIIFSV